MAYTLQPDVAVAAYSISEPYILSSRFQIAFSSLFIMSAIKGVLIDLSGTIHIDKKVIPGAIEAVQRLKSSEIPFRY